MCNNVFSVFKAKLRGQPWSTINRGDGLLGRALLLVLLNAFTSLGWRLVSSADVSAKYVSQDINPDYRSDVHSWYFMYGEAMLAEMQAGKQPIYRPVIATAPPSYDAPPNYEEATGFKPY